MEFVLLDVFECGFRHVEGDEPASAEGVVEFCGEFGGDAFEDYTRRCLFEYGEADEECAEAFVDSVEDVVVVVVNGDRVVSLFVKPRECPVDDARSEFAYVDGDGLFGGWRIGRRGLEEVIVYVDVEFCAFGEMVGIYPWFGEGDGK